MARRRDERGDRDEREGDDLDGERTAMGKRDEAGKSNVYAKKRGRWDAINRSHQ